MHTSPPAKSDDSAAVAAELAFGQFVVSAHRALATAPLGWLVVIGLCWDRVPSQRLLWWTAAFFALTIANWVATRAVNQAGPSLERHGRLLMLVAAMEGLSWGLMAGMLIGFDAVADAWLVTVLCGFGAITVPVFITHIRAYRLQIAVLWISAVLGLFGPAGTTQPLYVIATLTLFYTLLLFYMHPIAQRVHEGIRLQLANAALAERLTQALQSAEQAASTDALTQVPNRRALDELLQRFVAANAAGGTVGGRRFSLLMLDIDHFKPVNDTHGHATGDALLRAFAARMRDLLRPGDFFARYGGEEFAALLPDADLTAALEIAERLRSSTADADLLPKLTVTASIGVATHLPGENVTALLARADAAVYAAKHGGRNRVCAAGEALV